MRFINRIIKISRKKTLTYDDIEYLWMTGLGVLFLFFSMFLILNFVLKY